MKIVSTIAAARTHIQVPVGMLASATSGAASSAGAATGLRTWRGLAVGELGGATKISLDPG